MEKDLVQAQEKAVGLADLAVAVLAAAALLADGKFDKFE